MCGIAGQIGRDPRAIQGRYAAYCAMQRTLARRGPDQRGMYISGRAAQTAKAKMPLKRSTQEIPHSA